MGTESPNARSNPSVSISAIHSCVSKALVRICPLVGGDAVDVAYVQNAESSDPPAGPWSPCGPVGPGSPVAPVAPAGPVAPVVPAGPVGPVAPVGPWGPTIWPTSSQAVPVEV